MADNLTDVEHIVRDVIARLGGVSAEHVRPSSPETAAATAGEVTIAARVVTLDTVRNKLEGIRQIVVHDGAVITPAVRDLLREKNVTLSYRRKTDGRNKAGGRLVVGIADTNFEPAALVRIMSQSGVSVEQLAKTGLVRVVDELTDQVGRGGMLGLLLTSRTAAAVCLANRARGVRAVLADSARNTTKTIEEVAANMLVIDPAAQAEYALRRAVTAFCQSNPRQLPADLAERLA